MRGLADVCHRARARPRSPDLIPSSASDLACASDGSLVVSLTPPPPLLMPAVSPRLLWRKHRTHPTETPRTLVWAQIMRFSSLQILFPPIHLTSECQGSPPIVSTTWFCDP